MKKILSVLAMILILTGSVYAANIKRCILTFTNITTLSTGATSCSRKCSINNNCAIDTAGAETIRVSHIPNAVTHTATDWDVEVWVSDDVDGPFKYYTDAETADGALTTIGTHATNTRYDVTNPTGSTMRYTYDGTGTDPTITTTDPPVGSAICIAGFATANNGCFIVSATASDYFEVYNPSGSAETNIVPGANNIVSGTNAAKSNGITTGYNYTVIKISENGALRVDSKVIVTVDKN